MTVSDVDLAWLAGVIDSEGTISLTHSSRRNPSLRVSIYNSSDLILDKCARTLRGLDIRWYEFTDRRAARTAYAFHISTAGAMRLYPHVRPHMVRQSNRYDAGVAFMESRNPSGAARVRWSDQDRDTWEQLRGVLHAR